MGLQVLSHLVAFEHFISNLFRVIIFPLHCGILHKNERYLSYLGPNPAKTHCLTLDTVCIVIHIYMSWEDQDLGWQDPLFFHTVPHN